MEDQIRSVLDEMLKEENVEHIVINPNANKKVTILCGADEHELREAIEKRLVSYGYSMENITSLCYSIPSHELAREPVRRNLGILNSISRANIAVFAKLWKPEEIECVRIFVAYALSEGTDVYQAYLNEDDILMLANYEDGEEL